MTLDAYLRTQGAESLTDLSEAAKVSKGRLSQLRDGSDVPPDLALRLEEATAGRLNAATLSSIVRKARATGAAA